MLLLPVTRKIDKNTANVDFLSFRDKIYTWQTQGLWANILLAQKVSLDVSEKKGMRHFFSLFGSNALSFCF